MTKLEINYIQTTQNITEEISILYCISNTTITLDQQSFPVKKGDILLVHPGIHYSSLESLDIFQFHDSLFDSLFISQIADCRIIYDFIQSKDSNTKDYLFFSMGKNKEFLELLHILKQELQQSDSYTSKLIHLLSVGIFTMLDRYRPQSLIVQNSTMIASNRFGKLLKYMGDHYSEVSLAMLAEKFNYNPDYLSTRFKEITGMSFSSKLLMIRLDESCRLLENSEYTVEEISSIIGFKDKSYFIRKFKESYSLPPAKWRKAHI